MNSGTSKNRKNEENIIEKIQIIENDFSSDEENKVTVSDIERHENFVANAIDTLEKLKSHPDFNFEEGSQHGDDFFKSVSYTHLTLPTILRV